MAFKAHLEPIRSPADDPHSDRRRHPRRTLRLETCGTLPDGIEANVTVHNLSAAGLLLETDMPLDVGDTLAVDLPQVGPVGAEIVWQSQHLNGCAFQQALGEAALAAAELHGKIADLPHGGAHSHTASQGTADGDFPITFDTLGMRLHRIRREQGLTLAQVAEALGVSKPTVWAWEKGKAKPLPERMDAIANALGVEPNDLIDAQQTDGIADVLREARIRIATAYDTDPSRVRIMIEI